MNIRPFLPLATQQITPTVNSYYKSRLLQPRCLLMSIAGRFYSARKFYKTLVRSEVEIDSNRLLPTAKKQSLFPLLNVEKTLVDLHRDGAALRINLPMAVVKQIHKFAETTTCYGDRKGKFGFRIAEKAQVEKEFGQQFQKAQYIRADLKHCPAIRKIETDPVINTIARQYFGIKPVHLTTRLFWSFANNKESYDAKLNSTHYHYDLDDYGCIRFFFYITDVDKDSGPHAYIKGSHKRKSLYQKLIKSHAIRSDEEMIDYYGKDQEVTICGTKGSGFAQDSMCFHKATRPERKDRLLLQVTFAINDYHLHDSL